MKQLVEIKSSSKEIIRVSYLLTTSCSYQCRYCPDHLHTGQNKKIDLKAFELFLSKIRKYKKVLLDVTGGEATLHPQFVDLIKICKSLDIKTSVGSNASRTTRWFSEYADLVDNWMITIHPSQHLLDIEKIKIISESTFTVVYVMMDPQYWDTAISYYHELSKIKNIKIVLLKIIDNWGNSSFSAIYSADQLDYIRSNNSIHTFEQSRIDEMEDLLELLDSFNNLAVWSDGSTSDLDPYMLIKNHQNKFYGWNCYAGQEVISIDNDGNVYWGNCRAKFFGHYSDINFSDLTNKIKCPLLSCDCTSDIRTSKSKL